jgi:hypothetical protein
MCSPRAEWQRQRVRLILMSFACMRLVALPDPASSRRLPPPLLVAVRQQWVLAVLKYHGQWRRLSYLKRRRCVCYFRAQVMALRRPTTVRAVLAARQQWFVMDLKNWLASSTPTQDLLRRMLALPSCWAHSGTVAITLALHELDGFERLPQRACWLQRLWWLQRLHDEARGPSAKPQGCVPACPVTTSGTRTGAVSAAAAVKHTTLRPSSTPPARACSVSRLGSCKVCVF